jgi:pseudouridine-5'-phosphate glycosidase
MNLDGGILVGVPLPAESALSGEVTRAAIKKALARVAKEQITGKSVTPALLKVIGEETKGQSLTANIALIKNNANVGARLAVALAQNYE